MNTLPPPPSSTYFIRVFILILLVFEVESYITEGSSITLQDSKASYDFASSINFSAINEAMSRALSFETSVIEKIITFVPLNVELNIHRTSYADSSFVSLSFS